MLQITEQASSIPHLATKLLVEFFSDNELTGDSNVRGVAINRSLPKRALDPKKVDTIKRFCSDQVENGEDKEIVRLDQLKKI